MNSHGIRVGDERYGVPDAVVLGGCPDFRDCRGNRSLTPIPRNLRPERSAPALQKTVT
jgi:hypothetical protein